MLKWGWFTKGSLFSVLLACLAGVLPDEAQADSFLRPVGGVGGSSFRAFCPAGQNLHGVELRAGDTIDAIRPICVASFGPREFSRPILTSGSGLETVPSPLSIKVQRVVSGWYGGPGGGITPVLCPDITPIVIGLTVYDQGDPDRVVNSIYIYCGQALPVQTASTAQLNLTPSNQYKGRWDRENPKTWGSLGGTAMICPPGEVAIGIHGRSGDVLDALGLICAPPRLEARPTGTLPGRTKSLRPRGTSATLDTSTSPRGLPAVCASAQSARARNSPAAPLLEAQCRAQKSLPPKGPVKSLRPRPTSGTSPICNVAKLARDRNSPAAPSLEARCRAEQAQEQPPGEEPQQVADPEPVDEQPPEAGRSLDAAHIRVAIKGVKL